MSLLQGWMEPIVTHTDSILRGLGAQLPLLEACPGEQGTFSVQCPPDILDTRFALGPEGTVVALKLSLRLGPHTWFRPREPRKTWQPTDAQVNNSPTSCTINVK